MVLKTIIVHNPDNLKTAPYTGLKRAIARVLWKGIFGLSNEDIKKRLHPTQKPTRLAIWFIEKFSKVNTIIVDLFIGSGTTLIACEQIERTCYGMEIEPRYIDIILDRWTKLTGEEPLREDGITWSELKTENGIQ